MNNKVTPLTDEQKEIILKDLLGDTDYQEYQEIIKAHTHLANFKVGDRVYIRESKIYGTITSIPTPKEFKDSGIGVKWDVGGSDPNGYHPFELIQVHQ